MAIRSYTENIKNLPFKPVYPIMRAKELIEKIIIKIRDGGKCPRFENTVNEANKVNNNSIPDALCGVVVSAHNCNKVKFFIDFSKFV